MSAPSFAEAAQAHRTLAAFYEAQAAAQRPTQSAPQWIPQTRSPLGNRRHIAAVRRRVAAGEPGATLVGRKYLLTREALDHELGRVVDSRRPTVAPAVDELAALRTRLEKGRAA